MGSNIHWLRQRSTGTPEAPVRRRLPYDLRGGLRRPDGGPALARLRVACDLGWHTGCVNRLAWNTDGTMLASGSDDLCVVLWRWGCRASNIAGFALAPSAAVYTEHIGNIFGVKFIPASGGRTLVTCAADGAVFSHTLDAAARTQVRARPRRPWRQSAAESASAAFLLCESARVGTHDGRAKAIEVSLHSPHVWWSCGEDGALLQGDVRRPASDAVLRVSSSTRVCALRHVAANQERPGMLATGADDGVVRVFDLRMARPGAPLLQFAAMEAGCVEMQRRVGYRMATGVTCVAWDAAGRRLAANYARTAVTVFDVMVAGVTGAMDPHECSMAGRPPDDSDIAASWTVQPRQSAVRCRIDGGPSQLPAAAHHFKLAGDAAFKRGEANACRTDYERALHVVRSEPSAVRASMLPELAKLYSNHALACLKLSAAGDAAQAVHDCYRAIQCNPAFWKAYVRLAQGLQANGSPGMAWAFITEFLDLARARTPLSADLSVAITEAERVRDKLSADGMPPDYAISKVGFPWDALDTLRGASVDALGEKPPLYIQQCARMNNHSNCSTDILEVAFWQPPGSNKELLLTGSDDGYAVVYDADTSQPLAFLRSDTDVVNCVQPHPSLPVVATSGIESVVRLWAPSTDPDTRVPAPASASTHTGRRGESAADAAFYKCTTRASDSPLPPPSSSAAAASASSVSPSSLPFPMTSGTAAADNAPWAPRAARTLMHNEDGPGELDAAELAHLIRRALLR